MLATYGALAAGFALGALLLQQQRSASSASNFSIW
jgi:hypothetical protein